MRERVRGKVCCEGARAPSESISLCDFCRHSVLESRGQPAATSARTRKRSGGEQLLAEAALRLCGAGSEMHLPPSLPCGCPAWRCSCRPSCWEPSSSCRGSLGLCRDSARSPRRGGSEAQGRAASCGWGAGGVWAACWVQLSWAERVIADPSHRFALVWARLAAELAPAACVATTSCPLIIPPTVSPGGPNYGQDYAGSRRFGRSSVGTRPNLARFPIRPNPGEPRGTCPPETPTVGRV